MPKTVADLVSLLDLERLDTDLFRGSQPVTLLQRSFGGQVLAQALGAAQQTVADERIAHSLNAYFLRPGSPDTSIIYTVESTRDGGHFSSRRVIAKQNGRPIFSMSCSFHVPEPGLDHTDAEPVDVVPPEQCPKAAEVLAARSSRAGDFWEAEWGALDVRYVPEPAEGGPNHRAHARLWIRTEGALPDDPRLHQMVLAYLSDISLLAVATVPHQVEFTSPDVQAASIDHSMWFHRPSRADQWLLYDQVSPSASHGLGFSLGRLFADGRLTASCAQEGLIRVRPPATR